VAAYTSEINNVVFDKSYRNHGSVADYGHIAGYETVVSIKEVGRDIRLTASYTF